MCDNENKQTGQLYLCLVSEVSEISPISFLTLLKINTTGAWLVEKSCHRLKTWVSNWA